MTDNYEKIAQALMRQRGENERRQLAFNNAAARQTCGDVSIAILSEIIADAITASKRDLVRHMHRISKLKDMQLEEEKTRSLNLHKRLIQLESEVRVLRRGK